MYKQLFVITMSALVILSGCMQNNEGAQNNRNNQNEMIQVKNSSENNHSSFSNEEIATHLATIASDVPQVNNAAAVVAGPYAVVGIDVDKDLDRTRVGTVKYSVTEALHHDPYGKTAVVIADGDIMERLRSMGDQIQQGKPIQGIVEELSAIVGRYMPDFPIEDDQPVRPDQNKDVIPEEDEENLDDIQDEQSNQK